MEKQLFKLAEDQSEHLNQAKAERQALSGDLYEHLDKQKTLFEKLDSENLGEAQQETSKLNEGLKQAQNFNNTIADLAEGLTESLDRFVEFSANSKNYQGAEKVLALMFMKGAANRRRINRLKAQSPRENLELILDFGEQLVKEILEVREVAITTYQRLQANADVLTQKIAEWEPKQSMLREKLDVMEQAYETKNDEYSNADAQTQTQLQQEMNRIHKELSQLRNDYQQALTVYNQAQQALEPNRQSRNAFEAMAEDLGRQATMINEKLDNVTQIYMAAPEAVKVMMTTKGMERMDETINVATEHSVDMITQSAASVRDATLAREAVQLIDEKVMRGYMNRMEESMSDFNQRYDRIRDQAQRSQKERYHSDEQSS